MKPSTKFQWGVARGLMVAQREAIRFVVSSSPKPAALTQRRLQCSGAADLAVMSVQHDNFSVESLNKLYHYAKVYLWYALSHIANGHWVAYSQRIFFLVDSLAGWFSRPATSFSLGVKMVWYGWLKYADWSLPGAGPSLFRVGAGFNGGS
jgi:hypothetical protein